MKMTIPASVILGTAVTLTSSSIARAAALATSWQSELVVLRSLASPADEYSDIELNEDAGRLIESATAAQSSVNVRAVHSGGDPAAALAALAGASASILVMGPCGEPRGSRFDILRRTAIAVVEQAQRPVLVARSASRQPEDYARLLFFLDQDGRGVSSLLTASELFPSAEMHLLKRYTRPFPALLGNVVGGEELREDALEEVAEWLGRNNVPRPTGERMHRIVAEGESHRLVEHFARARAANLIVLPLTTAARHFLERGVLSEGGHFACFSECDFLLCPS